MLKFADQYYANNMIPSSMLSTINLHRLMHIDNNITVNSRPIADQVYDKLFAFSEIGEDLTEVIDFI